MAEKTVLETRNLFHVADDMEGLQNNLRIMQDMLVDHLCSYNVSDMESMGQSLERIHFLVNLLPEKLTQMASLNAELFCLRDAEKRAAIAA